MTATGVSVGQLLERLSFAGLAHRAGALDAAAVVTTVTSSDEEPTAAEGGSALVLGIGLADRAAVEQAWRRWSRAGAAALVVRSALLGDEPLAVPPGRTVLLGLGAEMSWIRLAGLVSGDAEQTSAPGALRHLDGVPAGDDDAYVLANSLASLLGGPVTIEDLSSRIVAFSADQDRGDEHRKRAILERQVSPAHNAVLEEDGVFAELYASSEPIFFQPRIPGARPRIAMRIRYGEESLGSIWAVHDSPPTAVQSQGLVEASNLLALSIMRRRLLDDARSHEQHQLVDQLLRGGRDAMEAAAGLGTADLPAFVVALGRVEPGSDEVDDEYQLRTAARTAAAYLSSVSRRAVVAPVGSQVYAVVPVTVPTRQSAELPAQHAAEARRTGQHLVQRLGRGQVCLGIGDLVPDVSQLARSRRQADTAVRVLRDRHDRGHHGDEPHVAYWRDLQVDALLMETVDAMTSRQEPLGAPFDRLPLDQPDQVATLTAYLERLGDVSAAAADVFVHPNTFRYRLRRIAERSALDLDDPDVRFALMYQLRLHRRRSGD
ncbi:MAG: hypothetical protein F2667_09060 [Actinobacteria bacterium]|uniref:Unannotated protein n=1 Tax=freshwater metagenome TaxID=449393 RepID=A0A6J6QY85_9ZZZZ|nr:hypothetical protein [Actinomycetota bacterium]